MGVSQQAWGRVVCDDPGSLPMEGTAILGILEQPPALPFPDFSDSISKTRIPGYKSGEYGIVSPGVTGQGAQSTAAPACAATDPAAALASMHGTNLLTFCLSPLSS